MHLLENNFSFTIRPLPKQVGSREGFSLPGGSKSFRYYSGARSYSFTVVPAEAEASATQAKNTGKLYEGKLHVRFDEERMVVQSA